MPDEELIPLARNNSLRKNLAAQVKRMLADPKSAALTENFSGQWLQARDIEAVPIESRAVLARDEGNTGNQGFGGRNFGNRGDASSARNWTATCARPCAAKPKCISATSCVKTAACWN